MSVGSKSDSGSYRGSSAGSAHTSSRDTSGGWSTWRASQWDALRKHVSTHRRHQRQSQPSSSSFVPGNSATAPPQNPSDGSLLHAVSSDVAALNKLTDLVKRLKKELLQLKQWEELRLANLQAGKPPPPPLPFLVTHHHHHQPTSPLASPTSTIDQSSKKSKHRKMPSVDHQDSRRHHQPDPPRETASDSPNSSDETEKQGSVNEKIEEKKRQLKAAQDAERLRRREMARKVSNTAERVKQEQRRRIQRLAEYEREQFFKEQERIRAGETRSDGATGGGSNRTAPSTPFTEHLGSDYFTNVPASSTSAHIDPAREVRYRSAWSRYAAGWARITGKLPSAPTQYTFASFPWPTVDPPITPADLSKEAIMEFMYHAPQDFHPSVKVALHEAVRRWHPDRSNSVWTHETIVAEAERLLVKKGADIVIRVLNQLSADEKESP